MRRLTDHSLLVAGISLLLLSSQVQAFSCESGSRGCASYPTNKPLLIQKTSSSKQSAQARRATPTDAAQPAVAIPPEVLNLQLRSPVSKR